MRMQRNFYEVLGVQRNATQQEIKAKYLALARQYHPDRAKDKEIADRLFVQINRAYSTLSNVAKREQYDATLIAASQVPAARPTAQQSRPGQPAGAGPSQPAAEPITPQTVRQWFDEAARLQIKGEYEKALALCQKVLSADPNHFPGLLLTGDLLAQTGKEQEALTFYHRAEKIQPTSLLLREKITRLTALISRRTTGPIPPFRPAAPNIKPGTPSAPEAAQKRPADPPAKEPAQQKSFLDRLMNRK